MTDIENGIRERLAEFLPRALAKAIQVYEHFLDQWKENGRDAGTHAGAETNGKTLEQNLKAHQEASKAAIAQVETLFKMAEKAGLLSAATPDDRGEFMEELLSRSIAEIKAYDAREEGGDAHE